MFLDNKYTRWYWALIRKAQAEKRTKTRRGQYHRHHIVPKCLGGGEGDNLVLLTPREHYVVHLLLIRMTRGRDRSRMVYAFRRFRPEDRSLSSSRAYEAWRASLSMPCPDFVRQAISRANKGKKRTEEQKKTLSEAHLNSSYRCTEEHRKKLSEANLGRIPDEDMRRKISDSHLKRWAPLTPEMRKARGRPTSPEAVKAIRDAWASKTPEEKAEIRARGWSVRHQRLADGTLSRPVRSEELRRQTSILMSKLVWIRLGELSKRVPLDELALYQDNGWMRGRATRPSESSKGR